MSFTVFFCQRTSSLSNRLKTGFYKYKLDCSFNHDTQNYLDFWFEIFCPLFLNINIIYIIIVFSYKISFIYWIINGNNDL